MLMGEPIGHEEFTNEVVVKAAAVMGLSATVCVSSLRGLDSADVGGVCCDPAALSHDVCPVTTAVPKLRHRPPQDTTAVIIGTVTDAKTGQPVANVEVTIEGTGVLSVTDMSGRYRIVSPVSGPQTVRTRRIGYAPNRVPTIVPPSGTLELNIEIAVSALLLEGLVVTGDPVGRARDEIATATVIDIEAIRHQTATSLAGVLELVPGVEQQPPGLDQPQQFALRSVATSGSSAGPSGFGGGTRSEDLAAFGTSIVLDGVPTSNNANLQSLGPRGELSFTTSANGGVDLRKIPASTLERVEVIRGIPSARWGDLTQGVVIVETRAGQVTPELKLHVDARTAEMSIVGGSRLGTSNTVTATFDYANTRSSPGLTDDRVCRLAGQLKHRMELGRFRFDTGFDFFQLYDDRPASTQTGREDTHSSSRDRGFRVTERALWQVAPRSRFRFTGGVTGAQQRSFAVEPKVRSAMPFTDRLDEGRQEGHYVIGQYLARVDVEGSPWSSYGRFEFANERNMLGAEHSLRAGAELKREWNSGPGLQFDIQFPPQVTFNGVNGFDRPRDNNSIPALATTALYLDDQIHTTVGEMVLQLQAGLRLDVLHEGSWWFSGVRDALLQPRIYGSLLPLHWLRLHAGWGYTAKTPPLGMLYPAPQYYDVVNVNYYADDPAERLAVLTTYVTDPTNNDLGYSRGTKAEVGVEFGIGSSAISVVAFRDRIDDGVGIRYEPTSLERDHFALTDSVLGNGIKPDIIEPSQRSDTVPVLIYRPDNNVTQINRGLELIATFPELRPIRTRFQVMGSWMKTEQRTEALYFGNAGVFSNFQLHEADRRTPYWGPATEVGERALMTYRVIHHQPSIGLLITAMLQHNITDLFKDLAATDTLAFLGYLTNDARLVPIPEAERGEEQYRDLRLPRSGLLLEPASTPADWMLSVQVSKTLPLDGRLDFWAFNMLDRPGQVAIRPGMRPRFYVPVRVGLEVTVPVRTLLPWTYKK